MAEEVSNDGAGARKPSFNDMPPDESGFASEYSKDYWDLVFEQLGRRPLFKVAMAVLAIVYASAIYAPLIANGRPYVIEAIDLGGYRSATSSLSSVHESEETP